MPSKNRIKIYVENAFYHIYNRGVEKRIIFKEDQDYKVFLKYLKEALLAPIHPDKSVCLLQDPSLLESLPRQPKNFNGKIELICFCLMPNHFHFLIKQSQATNIKDFMRSLTTRYSMYFNKKYNRVGSLFQGRYKAVLIDRDDYLLHLSRYIHLNPLEYCKDITKVYSSYLDFLGLRKTTWLKPEIILSFFNRKVLPGLIKALSYQNFVESYKKDSGEILGDFTLE